LTQVAFVIPGDIAMLTGGYAYDRRVLALLPAHGVTVRHVALPGSYPMPTDADLQETARVLAALPQDTVLLMDGLAYGAMPDSVVRAITQRIVALCHHPLALEEGVSAERARALQSMEMFGLAQARHVVVTSRITGQTLLADFGVGADKMTVAEPGTDRAARATGTRTPLQLLAVGSIVPRKGYDVLARALASMRVTVDWRLTIVGAVRDAQARAALDASLQLVGADGRRVAERVTVLSGVADAGLAQMYRSADVFVMPSLYEGYGMVLAEAMARGLPIVCTTGGAAAETAPDAAAIKVVPGDAAAFADGLARVMSDAALRRRMSDAAWAAGQALPTWDDTARRIADVLKKVAA
jgi:glycosyltransferase involved in cell wall biosynthesis